MCLSFVKKKMYKRVKPKQSQMEIVKLKYTITSLSMRRCMVQTVVGGWVAHELLCVEACMVARFRAASALDKGRQAILTAARPVPFTVWHWALFGGVSFLLGGIFVLAWLLYDL